MEDQPSKEFLKFTNECIFREMLMAAMEWANRRDASYPDMERRLEIMEEFILDYKEAIEKERKRLTASK